MFLDDEWESVGLEAGKPLEELVDPDWRVNLHGTLRVRTTDEYIGSHDVGLKQEVEITPDFLHSQTHLAEPAERLQRYDMKTHFDRDASTGKARVSLELTQEILTDAPFWSHSIADRRVRQSAERTLENQERAIRQLIAEHRDDVPLFPLR